MQPRGGAETVVKVDSTQRATVVGSFDSLGQLLKDLALKADFELRDFATADRSVRAAYRDQPLRVVLERLLRDENYILGIEGGETDDAPVRISWLRVSGTSGVAGLRGFSVPANFGAASFEKEDAGESQVALGVLAEQLLASGDSVSQLLELPPAELARSLAHYPHVDSLLGQLQKGDLHPDLAAKIYAVRESLAATQP